MIGNTGVWGTLYECPETGFIYTIDAHTSDPSRIDFRIILPYKKLVPSYPSTTSSVEGPTPNPAHSYLLVELDGGYIAACNVCELPNRYYKNQLVNMDKCLRILEKGYAELVRNAISRIKLQHL